MKPNINIKDINFVAYTRKSSESEDRQVLSLNDQKKELVEQQKREGLKVVKGFLGDEGGESGSAHKRGRPLFNEMMRDIEKGKANGIQVWHPNRLARNAFDAGQLITAMDEGKLLVIKTPYRIFVNTPEDKFTLFLEFGLAKKSSDDNSVAVKRGLRSKVEKGWRPGVAPLGWLNTKHEVRGENYLIKDPERFKVLRKAWDMMLTGRYTPSEVLDCLTNKWDFKTRGWKKKGGKPMSRSTIYRMFTNVFYAGLLEVGDDLVPGKHPPMITVAEYDRVQEILGRKGKPRPNRFKYAFTGMITCGECGGRISATYKKKFIKRDGKVKDYPLYYCPNARHKRRECSQGLYTNAEAIEEVVMETIERVAMTPEIQQWAVDILAEQDNAEADEKFQQYEAQQKALDIAQKKIDNLLQLRLRDAITDDEFAAERSKLKNEIVRLEMAQEGAPQMNWRGVTREAFNFAADVREAFVHGNNEVKKTILTAMCVNQTLRDKKYSFKAVEWIEPIENVGPRVKSEYELYELDKKPYNATQKVAYDGILSLLRERRDLNPQPPP